MPASEIDHLWFGAHSERLFRLRRQTPAEFVAWRVPPGPGYVCWCVIRQSDGAAEPFALPEGEAYDDCDVALSTLFDLLSAASPETDVLDEVVLLGETYRLDEIQAGVAEAHRQGFDPEQVKLATVHDVLMATYLFGLLGRNDEEGRRCGAFGLRRLIAAMSANSAV